MTLTQTGDLRPSSCQETKSVGADALVSRLSVSALSVLKQTGCARSASCGASDCDTPWLDQLFAEVWSLKY